MESVARVDVGGTSGRYVYKNWTRGVDGQRLGAVPAAFGETPPDLIASYYRNSNGGQTIYAIPIDLDASRASSDFKNEDGSLEWKKMRPVLEEKLPDVTRYIGHVTTSSGGQGLSLVIAIKPLPIQDSTYKNQQMYCLTQGYLIKALSKLGFGADPAAVGLCRDFPNFVDPSRSIESNPFVFRMLERSVDESHFTALMSSCIGFLRAEESQERLYPDLRVEQGVALFFEYLLNHPGNQQVSLKFLVSLTGLSKRFLRKLLKEAEPWLLARPLGRGKGWEVSLNEEDSYLERRKARMAGLLRGEPFRASVAHLDAFSLCLPGDVEDGERNDWIHRLVLIYKWHGFLEANCLEKVTLRVRFIPGAENSRNARNVGDIVRSIYRNHGNHFGKFAGLGLPEWILHDSLFVVNDIVWGGPSSEDCQTPTPLKVIDGKPLALSPEPVVAPLVPLEVSDEVLEPSFDPVPLLVPEPMVSDPKEPSTLEGPVPVVLTGVLGETSSLEDSGSELELEVTSNPQCNFLRLVPSSPVRTLSLQKGCNPIKDSFSEECSRLVLPEAHFTFRGVRYSVDQRYVGSFLDIRFDSVSGKIYVFHEKDLVEFHDFSNQSRGKVTKPQHLLFPQRPKVRLDGHVLFHGKLYSTGQTHIGRKVVVSHLNGVITISDVFGEILAVHESIQDQPFKASTLEHHFGLWENALKIDSYYRQTARSYGLEVEAFVLGILRSKPGLIDSSRIHQLFSLGKKHDRDLFLSLVTEQVEKRDYRLRPLMAMLDWLDG